MRLPSFLKRPIEYITLLFTRFGEHQGALISAAVSFFVFLSIVPMLLLAVAAFGLLLQSNDRAYSIISGFLSQYSPAAAGPQAGSDLLSEIIRGSTAASGIGALALLWSGSQAFVTLELAINIAWGLDPRNFIKQRLVAIFMLIAVGALLFLSFATTTVASAIMSDHTASLGRWGSIGVSWVFRLLSMLLPIVVTILAFTLVYKILPNTYVPPKAALLGGTVAGLLWEVAKQVFGYYLAHFANYNAVYGSLAGLILTLIWIQYSSIVTLLGAEMASIYHSRHS